MELILKQGEVGLRQDLLLQNKEYYVFREGDYLGIAKYIEDDPVHGAGFFSDMLGMRKVFVADEWELTGRQRDNESKEFDL